MGRTSPNFTYKPFPNGLFMALFHPELQEYVQLMMIVVSGQYQGISGWYHEGMMGVATYVTCKISFWGCSSHFVFLLKQVGKSRNEVFISSSTLIHFLSKTHVPWGHVGFDSMDLGKQQKGDGGSPKLDSDLEIHVVSMPKN